LTNIHSIDTMYIKGGAIWLIMPLRQTLIG